MKKLYATLLSLLGTNVFALNVIPACQDVSSMSSSQVYSTDNIFYTTGLNHQYFALSPNQCINGYEPGVYQTTLILTQDGNLVNYVYDVQKDINYITFSSDTQNQQVSSALVYLDSGLGDIGIELLDKNYSLIKQITPSATKQTDSNLAGTMVMSGLDQSNSLFGLTTYDNSDNILYSYSYNMQPVNYVDFYFDKQTLEAPGAQYTVTIDDQNQTVCALPLSNTECGGMVKLVAPNHYIVYLKDDVNIQIAKTNSANSQQSAIYFEGQKNIYLGWSDEASANISLNSISPQLAANTYIWTPSPATYSSSFHLLSWGDKALVALSGEIN